MSHVLDASTVLAAVMSDEASPTRRVTDVLNRCEDVYVPMLWFSEVANAILAASKRRRVSDADATRILKKVQELRVQPDRTILDLVHVFDVAKQYELSVYDATYLELAMRTGSQLLTMDVTLARAARSAGVKVLK